MKSTIAVLHGVIILLCTATTQAQTPSDHLDVSYERLEVEFVDHKLNADGYGIAFTKDYSDQFLLLAGFKRYVFDEYDLFRMQQDIYNVGIGLHKPIGEGIDVFGQLLFNAIESDLETGSIDDRGVEAVVGFRTIGLQHFGFETSVRYLDYEDPISLTGPEVSITGQANWYLSDLVTFGIGANFGEYETSWFGNFRFNFDLSDE